MTVSACLLVGASSSRLTDLWRVGVVEVHVGVLFIQVHALAMGRTQAAVLALQCVTVYPYYLHFVSACNARVDTHPSNGQVGLLSRADVVGDGFGENGLVLILNDHFQSHRVEPGHVFFLLRLEKRLESWKRR